MKRVLIIGAGPTGIAAALGALRRGHDVTVIEKGEVGEALLRWGATRFFTPLSMNVTADMREHLGDAFDADALLTGPEFARLVLQKLAASEPLRDRIHTHARVVAVGRRGLARTEYAGHPIRSEKPFRVLVQNANGEEQLFEADVVLDASGGFARPMPLGSGGLPARGERSLNGEVTRFLGGVDESLTNLRLLLIGHGHSAANAIAALSELGATRVTWAVRTANRRPCTEVADDPLPERRTVVARANELAEDPPAWLTVKRRATIDGVAFHDGAIDVTFSNGDRVTVDRILGFTGYRPDDTHLGELAIETSPVTEGGAKLYRAISNVTDCLTVPSVSPKDLETGEPNFYFAGSRSYGRARTFLLQTGYAQLEAILDSL